MSVAGVLEAPSKGAAALLRYLTLGEEPRLKQGSSWELEGPGLADMASSGYSDIGELLASELYPEAEGTNTELGRQIGAISSFPFGAVLEGMPTAGIARAGLLKAGSLAQKTSPLARMLRTTPYRNYPITKQGIDTAVARVGAKLDDIERKRQQASFWLKEYPILPEYLDGLSSRAKWLEKARETAEASRKAAQVAAATTKLAGGPLDTRLYSPVSEGMWVGLIPALSEFVPDSDLTAQIRGLR